MPVALPSLGDGGYHSVIPHPDREPLMSGATAVASPASKSTSVEIPRKMSCIKKLKAEPGLDWVEEVAVPEVGPTDVLVQVTHAGICGTDRHIFEWDAWASS